MAGSVQSGLVPPPPAVYIRTRIVVLYLHSDCGVKVALGFWVLELHSCLLHLFWVCYKDRGCTLTF